MGDHLEILIWSSILEGCDLPATISIEVNDGFFFTLYARCDELFRVEAICFSCAEHDFGDAAASLH